MKRSVALKSTLRQPVRTAALLVLVALTAFLFLSRAVEGVVVTAELNRLAGTYRSIGTLKPIGDRTALAVPPEVVALLEADEAVKFTNTKRLISGVMDGVHTPDLDGMSPYPNAFFLYGTLEKKGMGEKASGDAWLYWFDIRMDTLDLGLPDYVQPGETIRLYLEGYDETLHQVYHDAEVGQRYYLKGQYGLLITLAYTWQRATDYDGSFQLHLLLRPLDAQGTYLYPVAEGGIANLPHLDEEKAKLQENIRTIFLRTTKDMSALPETARSLTLLDGRWLDEADNTQGNRVCVIREEFAELRGLTVGDTITVTMRNLPPAEDYTPPETMLPGGRVRQYDARNGSFGSYGLDMAHNLEMATGYIGLDEASWREAETAVETFEIVGVYNTSERIERVLTLSHNQVYIPASCVPSDWTQAPLFTTLSFLLRDPGAERDFHREYLPKLDALGVWLQFVENRYDAFAASTAPIRASIAIGVIGFAVLALTTFYLVAFLFFHQRRQDFAILRALGTPSRAALGQTALPIVLIGVLGILPGGILAWFFAQGKAQATLAGVEDAVYHPPAAWWLPLLLLGMLALYALFVWLQAYVLGRQTVLALLQGKRVTRRRRQAAPVAADTDSANIAHAPVALQVHLQAAQLAPPDNRGGSALAHALRTAIRRIARMPGKYALVVLVAAGSILLVSWIPRSIASNILRVDELYDNTIVTAEIAVDLGGLEYYNSTVPSVGGAEWEVTYVPTESIQGRMMQRILSTGFILDYYAESMELFYLYAPSPTRPSPWYGIYALGVNLPLYNERHPDEPFSVEFAEGYSMEDFLDEDHMRYVALVDREWAEQRGYKPGDELVLANDYAYTHAFTIIGWHTYGETQIVVPIDDLEHHTDFWMTYSRADFRIDPAKNRELDEFREKIDMIFSSPMRPLLTFILRDYLLTDVVLPLERNIALMRLLYPIALTVTVLIAAALALLLVLQGGKDAAILRVLGTTKRRTCVIFLYEQGLPSLLGLLLGGAGAVALFGSVNLPVAALYLAACLLAALVAAYLVTRKKPLELLQAEE